jgi:hypothetical protein
MLGCFMPQTASAASENRQAPSVLDVRLHDGNVLLGHVLDQNGAGKAFVPVVLYEGGQKLAETRTDAVGQFGFRNLRGGVYQLTAAGGTGAYRFWAHGTAPPSAQAGAVVYADTDVVRGNLGRLKFWLSHPVVIGGAVITAVAVPVILHNSKSRGAATP